MRWLLNVVQFWNYVKYLEELSERNLYLLLARSFRFVSRSASERRFVRDNADVK